MLIEPETRIEEDIYVNNWRIRNKDFIDERRYLLKLIHLKHCLANKEKYLVMVLQYRPRIFNSIITNNNPNITALKEIEEKHLEAAHNTRMKWN
jgi:hypothetical protein